MIGANNTITTYRMAETSGKRAFSGTPTLSSVECVIMGTDPRLAPFLDTANIYETRTLYLDQGYDIERGDKVIDRNSQEYIVNNILPQEADEVEGVLTVLLKKKFDRS